MRNIHIRTLAFVGGVLLIVYFVVGINVVPTHAATKILPDIGNTWQGQGTYNNGQASFDMILTIASDDGSTFSGNLHEKVYNSTVAINGSIANASDSGSTITFTDPSSVSGNQIQLNCTYTATISNGQMTGHWYYPGHSSPDGTISLSKMPAPDFSDSGSSAQSAQLRNRLTPLKQWFNHDTMDKIVNLVSQAEDAMGCANNLHEMKQQWVGAVSVLSLSEETLLTCGKTALRQIVTFMENTGKTLQSEAPAVEALIEDAEGAIP